MSVVDGLRALPADLRDEPTAAAWLLVAIVAMAAVPASIYGGNIGATAALSLGALVTLSIADTELEEAP